MRRETSHQTQTVIKFRISNIEHYVKKKKRVNLEQALFMVGHTQSEGFRRLLSNLVLSCLRKDYSCSSCCFEVFGEAEPHGKKDMREQSCASPGSGEAQRREGTKDKNPPSTGMLSMTYYLPQSCSQWPTGIPPATSFFHRHGPSDLLLPRDLLFLNDSLKQWRHTFTKGLIWS